MSSYGSQASDDAAYDDSYVSRSGHKNEAIPVQSDNDMVENNDSGLDPDSDKQLSRDEDEAIDRSNIVQDRTRGATKPGGTYREPGDEEGLPGPDDGTSSM